MATADTNRIEAPVTVRAYLMCAFAAFGGIFFGYDTGWMGSVQGMPYFITQYTGLPKPGPDASDAVKKAFSLASWQKSLTTSILSAGTFFGAIIAGDVADFIGRRLTIIGGCFIFTIGCICETASTGIALMCVGRVIAGLGVGFISAIIILYMSEIAPRKVRGALVSGYQFAITIGILLASCVTYATSSSCGLFSLVGKPFPPFSLNSHLTDHNSYRSLLPSRLTSLLRQAWQYRESCSSPV
jgi:MFS family permease